MKTQHKRILLIAVTLFIAVGLVINIFFTSGQQIQKSISPNTYYLTDPVMSLTGVIEKIQGNRLTVTYKVPPMPVPTEKKDKLFGIFSPPAKPTPKPIELRYTVIVDKDTEISRTTNFIPYLFNSSGQKPYLLDLKDIPLNSPVTIFSKTDLRILQTPAFHAATIVLPSVNNRIDGLITGIGNSIITIRTSHGKGTKELTVKVNSGTEISYIPNGEQEPIKLALSDLKTNTQVTMFTDNDVAGAKPLTALRIDPSLIEKPARFTTPGAPPPIELPSGYNP